MPLQDAGGTEALQEIFGIPAPPPPPPTAAPTVPTSPPVIATTPTSTPRPGQGVALTPSGVLPPSAAATGLRMLASDPAAPLVGEFWFRTDLLKMSVQTASGVKRSAAYT